MVRRTQVQFSVRMIGEARRLKARRARPRAVRGRAARAVRRRAGLEGAQVGEARGRQPPHRDRAAPAVPLGQRGRPRPARPELRAQGRRRGLQADRPPEDRGRQAPARRTRRRGDPADHVRGVGRAAHARLRALHPRPDPGADARDAGHGQGGAAHRRPVARHDEALHPPLQLPAVLGRRDRVHAGPEAPRHRPRRARRARTAAGDPRRRDVPVHDARRLRDPRVERQLVDGVGLRLDARR